MSLNFNKTKLLNDCYNEEVTNLEFEELNDKIVVTFQQANTIWGTVGAGQVELDLDDLVKLKQFLDQYLEGFDK